MRALCNSIGKGFIMTDGSKTKINQDFLSSLVCPLSRMPLKLSIDNTELISDAAAMAFPIRNNVPILLFDEARKID